MSYYLLNIYCTFLYFYLDSYIGCTLTLRFTSCNRISKKEKEKSE
jgi:hypothetical protein